MKTLCIMDSVSRENGGIFDAERKLQLALRSQMSVDVSIVGLRDAHTAADLAAWEPLRPVALPVIGPATFGYAPGFAGALAKLDADLACLVGLWKYPNIAAEGWIKRTRKPFMISPHGMLDGWALRNSGMKKKIAGWLFQNALLRRATCLRALCLAEVESIRAYGLRNPVCVIPNGIDLPDFIAQEAKSSRPAAFPVDRKVLLYLGRIHPKKGLAHLLAAWSRVRPAGKDWVLAIAGWDQGGHEEELKRQAEELGIGWTEGVQGAATAESLIFLGPQFGADKAACYQGCDAFILPSLSEGLPMVVLEAWAYAKPVLMTPECNLPEGLAAKAALRISGNEESMAAGLTSLFATSEADLLAMGRNGRQLVEERFSWSTIAPEMASVYRWMCEGGPRPSTLVLA